MICKDCKKRYVGCHSECAEYQAYRNGRLEECEERKLKSIECSNFLDYKVKSCNKAKSFRGKTTFNIRKG